MKLKTVINAMRKMKMKMKMVKYKMNLKLLIIITMKFPQIIIIILTTITWILRKKEHKKKKNLKKCFVLHFNHHTKIFTIKITQIQNISQINISLIIDNLRKNKNL